MDPVVTAENPERMRRCAAWERKFRARCDTRGIIALPCCSEGGTGCLPVGALHVESRAVFQPEVLSEVHPHLFCETGVGGETTASGNPA